MPRAFAPAIILVSSLGTWPMSNTIPFTLTAPTLAFASKGEARKIASTADVSMSWSLYKVPKDREPLLSVIGVLLSSGVQALTKLMQPAKVMS